MAGLAAQAVNEGRGHELVWVYNGPGDLEKWYVRLLARHPELETPGASSPWELVDRYAKQGIIKGYILYHSDPAMGGNAIDPANLDESVNVATSLAGLLEGVMVNEDLAATAQAHGLKLLLDVRGKTQSWCFQHYQNRFSRRLVCFQSPLIPHARDLAIAQRAFTAYGSDDATALALARLDPLSPILGCNGGDEFATTDLATGYGDFQTATDWSLNLPVLMAGTEKLSPPRATSFDPRTIDWNDARSAVAMVDTDGDNVQSLTGNFAGNPSYWGNAARGQIPYGWSVCFDQLAQLCPPAVEYLESTRTTNDWFIEWGGGYYYPDHFGRARAGGWELLARHARRTWDLMQAMNVRMIGFDFAQVDSPEARRACEVFAGQTDGLLAIFAFQYSPYEGGAGKVFWVPDRNGVAVPVITARYTIWEQANGRERAGTPAKVAREIRQTVEQTAAADRPRYDWVIDHVWSYFKRAPGTNEDAENMPQEGAAGAGGVCGYAPATWCAERLPAELRVVSPGELAWRIRMQHDPAQTRKCIARFQADPK